jgi:putative transcriptional regulator
MTMSKSRRALLWAGPALLGAWAFPAVVTAAADVGSAAPEPAVGELLIASAAIQDPRFYHSVILIVRHDQAGAFGIAINKPLGERPLAALLTDSSGKDKDGGGADKGAAVQGTIQVFLGGPVQPQFGFVVHSANYRRAETLAVADGLAMTATKEVLRDIGQHHGPAKYLFALGYSGWGAGQLEGEIARHDWFTEPATPDLVFDADRDAVWEKALARRTREL